MKYKTELDFMRQAIETARHSELDCPIGSIIVLNDTIIAKAHNEVEKYNDPLAHSEILCIQRACKFIGNKYLENCILYCTLEPCPMCLHAIKLSRIQRVIFGAFQDDETKHKLDCIGGILQNECSGLLNNFFKNLRI
jgi:tRNA(adenine34) deaminase